MDTRLFDLHNKTALITGASRGIGASIAALLAEHGAHVILTSRKIAGLSKVAEKINSDGGSASIYPCHIGDDEAINKLLSTLKTNHTSIDILVNNAATNPCYGHILDTDMAAFDKTIQVNLRGYFYLSQQIGRLMRKNGGGNIINIASINGVKPAIMQGPYSITKAAVIAMTQAFAKECAQDNIRVNAVLPGLTDTEFASALTQNEKLMQIVLPMIPLKRMAKPNEIAPAVLFLASPASSYITGSCITVDGGFLS